MTIQITPELMKLIDEEMKRGSFASIDDLLRAAIENLSAPGADMDDLDQETQDALARAQEQAHRGEGIPLDEAYEQLMRKHFPSGTSGRSTGTHG